MPFTVFVTAPTLGQAGVELLAQAQARVIYLHDANSVDAVEHIMASEPIDAVISRTVDLTSKAIRSCATLKVISKHGVGVNNIDVNAASERGIPVYVTPGANATSVAELTIGLMLAAGRHIGWMNAELHAGRWSRKQDGVEVCDRNLGLVGLGQVGQRVARIAQALGMQVHAFDPALRDGPCPVPEVKLHANLESLLPQSQIFSLHVPLTVHTRNLIGASQLAQLPRGAIFVNTARGEVVDELALVASLQSGHLHSAGLDTMAAEPLPPDHILTTLPNVVLTPHVGGSTPASLNQMAAGAARNILGWLQGAAIDSSVCVNCESLAFLSSTRPNP